MSTVANAPSDYSAHGHLVDNVGFRSSLGCCSEQNLNDLYKKYLATRYLLETGEIGKAWITIATAIRSAEILVHGRCRLPGHCRAQLMAEVYGSLIVFRRIWWMLVDLDAQLSFLLGRSPSIPQIPQVPQPAVTGVKQSERRLHRIVLDISSSLLEACRSAPSDLILQSYLGLFQDHQARLSRLLKEDASLLDAIQEHQFEVLLVLMTIHCRFSRTTRVQLPQEGCKLGPNENGGHEIRELAREIIDMFHRQEPEPQSWPRTFGAYCASSILLQLSDPGTVSTGTNENVNRRLRDMLTSPDSRFLSTVSTSFNSEPEAVQSSNSPLRSQKRQIYSSNVGPDFQLAAESSRSVYGSSVVSSGEGHILTKSSDECPFDSVSQGRSPVDFFTNPQTSCWDMVWENIRQQHTSYGLNWEKQQSVDITLGTDVLPGPDSFWTPPGQYPAWGG